MISLIRLAGVMLATCSLPAFAVPILWTLEDVYFPDEIAFGPTGDGGEVLYVQPVQVTGSFVYDQDTGSMTDVSISTPDGEVARCGAAGCVPGSVTIYDFSGFDYDAGRFNAAELRTGFWDVDDFTRIMVLNLSAELTNLGGVVGVVSALEYLCTACPAFDAANLYRTSIFNTGARLVGTEVAAVPAPPTIWLMITGLAGLFAIRRSGVRAA